MKTCELTNEERETIAQMLVNEIDFWASSDDENDKAHKKYLISIWNKISTCSKEDKKLIKKNMGW